MKKNILLLCLLIMLVLFTACNANELPNNDPSQATESSQSAEQTLLPGVVELEDPLEDPFASEHVDATDSSNDKQEQPTENQDSEQAATAPTENQGPEQETTAPTEETTPPATEGENNMGSVMGATDYEKYINMSGQEQKAYQESFSSMEAFFDWLIAAREEYEKANPDIEIDGGSVDLGGGSQP